MIIGCDPFIAGKSKWTKCGRTFRKKQKWVTDFNPEIGDQYVFVGVDAETKLVPSFAVGKRDFTTAHTFMLDLADRMAHRIQLTTDGFMPYAAAVERAFGANVDYAQLVKVYGSEVIQEARYSPPQIIAAIPTPIFGNPDAMRISTSYVERQNLTMRMQIRRFTRLTNGFSKKLYNLRNALALHFAHYNFVRVHSTLKVAPAVAAGLETYSWDIDHLYDTVMNGASAAA